MGVPKSLFNSISNFGFSNFIFCLICLVSRPLDIFKYSSFCIFALTLPFSLSLSLSSYISLSFNSLSLILSSMQSQLAYFMSKVYFFDILPLNPFLPNLSTYIRPYQANVSIPTFSLSLSFFPRFAHTTALFLFPSLLPFCFLIYLGR